MPYFCFISDLQNHSGFVNISGVCDEPCNLWRRFGRHHDLPVSNPGYGNLKSHQLLPINRLLRKCVIGNIQANCTEGVDPSRRMPRRSVRLASLRFRSGMLIPVRPMQDRARNRMRGRATTLTRHISRNDSGAQNCILSRPRRRRRECFIALPEQNGPRLPGGPPSCAH